VKSKHLITWFLLVSLVVGFSSLASADENPHAEDNMALFEQALELQGLIVPEFGAKDFEGASEMFAERASRYPDFFSGEWVFYAPGGDTYYWEHSARITTLNDFRVRLGTNALSGRLTGTAWKLEHNSVADTAGGYALGETEHYWYGLDFEEILGSDFYASYLQHDVNRGIDTPVLPDYNAKHLDFGFRSKDYDGFEWRANFRRSLFTSDELGMDDAAETGINVWAGYRASQMLRFYGGFSTEKAETNVPADANITNSVEREKFNFGVRYGGPLNNWCAGADASWLNVDSEPIFTSHLTGRNKYNFFIGHRNFYFVDRIRLGYESSNMDSVRLMYEEPAYEQLLIASPQTPAELANIIQTEKPNTDRWYVEGRFSAGPADINAKYSKIDISESATWVAGQGWPVISYWPDSQEEFRASVYVPIIDRISFSAFDWYRKSDNGARQTSLEENVLSGDLSFSVTERHTITVGYEKAVWETGGPDAAAIDNEIDQDTWRLGFAGDYDTWDFSLGYLDTTSNTTGLATDIGDWSTVEAEFNFKELCCFPIAVGCEVYDNTYDYNHGFDYDGWRIWMKCFYEF